jgi:hypothetical protein
MGPIIAVLLAGVSIFYLFRMLQESNRVKARQLTVEKKRTPAGW